MCKPQDHKQTEKCQQFVTVPKKGAAGTDPNPTIKEIKKKKQTIVVFVIYYDL